MKRTAAEVDAWIELIGVPMKADVEAIKRTLWVSFGAGGVLGSVLTLLSPWIVKQMGLG